MVTIRASPELAAAVATPAPPTVVRLNAIRAAKTAVSG
jgi:hypothetical protein